VRIFKTKWFIRYARRERIKDGVLTEAIGRAERRIIDADLGGGLIKQRVARPGEGRSGGYRTLIAYRSGDRAVFLYAFAKNERDNIENDELETLREIASAWLRADAEQVKRQIAEGLAEEIKDDENGKKA
jgi:hypothetical protein